MTTAASTPGVVAGIDGSKTALGAAQWAAEYAAGSGLALTLLHATPWGDDDAVLAAAEATVRSAHPDLVIRTATVKGAVANALSDVSESARIMVVGAGEHRVLGGHAVRIANRANCPVVVWRHPVAKRTGKPLPIVAGIDESEASTRALAEAFDIAALLHAHLTVVHTWEIDAAVGMGDLGGQGNMDWPLLEMLQNQQRQRMDELVGPLSRKYPNVQATKAFQDISPAKGLAELSRGAQLVVVGSHGRGRLAATLLGSVSQSLIHHAECPVLVVRAD